MSMEDLAIRRADGDELAWMDQAVCHETDPDLFVPTYAGQSPAAARRVCMACDVRGECLRYALRLGDELAFGEVQGIWGGTTEPERRSMRLAAAAGQVAA